MTLKKTFSTLLLAAILCAPFTISAQVTIGSDRAPSPWSLLDLDNSKRVRNNEQPLGLHLPRLDEEARYDLDAEAAGTPAQGLMIFNTDNECLEFWSGTQWISLCVDRFREFTTPHPENATICYNTAHPFALGIATGGSGAITYQWQDSIAGGYWNDIVGATYPTFTTPLLTASRYFRRLATAAVYGGTVSSNPVLITVHTALVTPPFTTLPAAICHNTTPADLELGASTGGSGVFIYQWQYRRPTLTGNWNDIVVGGNTEDLLGSTIGNLTETTDFRRLATNDCGTTYSDIVTVTVHPEIRTLLLPAPAAICYNTRPASLYLDPTEGGVGIFRYQWRMRRPAGTGDWTNIGGNVQNLPAATIGNLRETTDFKRRATNDCGVTYSNIVTITVRPQFTTPHPPQHDWAVHGNTFSINLGEAMGGYGGRIEYQWYSSPDIISGWVPGPMTQNLTTPVMNVGTHRFWRRRAWRTGENSCGDVFSDIMTIIVWARGNLTPQWDGVTPQPHGGAGYVYQFGRVRAWAATGPVTGWPGYTFISSSWLDRPQPCPPGWRLPTREDLQFAMPPSNTVVDRVGSTFRVRRQRGGSDHLDFAAPQAVRTNSGTSIQMPVLGVTFYGLWLWAASGSHNTTAPAVHITETSISTWGTVPNNDAWVYTWPRGANIGLPIRCVSAW